jgi:hypothetical protein
MRERMLFMSGLLPGKRWLGGVLATPLTEESLWSREMRDDQTS